MSDDQDAYIPTPTYFEAFDAVEYVSEDTVTVSRRMDQNWDLLLRASDREPIGCRINAPWRGVNAELRTVHDRAQAAESKLARLEGLERAAREYAAAVSSGRGAKDAVFPLHQAALVYASEKEDG